MDIVTLDAQVVETNQRYNVAPTARSVIWVTASARRGRWIL
ncbi:MAG: hypothetical protein V4737_12800 [Curtobacterium sp.]